MLTDPTLPVGGMDVLGEGYRGLVLDYPGHVTCLPNNPYNDATETGTQKWREAWHAQPSPWICGGHGIREINAW